MSEFLKEEIEKNSEIIFNKMKETPFGDLKEAIKKSLLEDDFSHDLVSKIMLIVMPEFEKYENSCSMSVEHLQDQLNFYHVENSELRERVAENDKVVGAAKYILKNYIGG